MFDCSSTIHSIMNHNTILQWNCRDANYNELLLLISLLFPKILCLQETFLRQSDKIVIRNYSQSHHIHDDCQRASGGSSIFVQSNVPHSLIDWMDKLQAIVLMVSLSKIIAICSIYIPPNTRLDQKWFRKPSDTTSSSLFINWWL